MLSHLANGSQTREPTNPEFQSSPAVAGSISSRSPGDAFSAGPCRPHFESPEAVSGGQQALPDTGCLPPTPLPPSCALLSLAAGSDHVRRRGRPTSLPQVPAPPGPACLPLAPSHHSCWFSPVGSLKSSTWTRTRVRCAGQTCPWEGWLTVGVGKGVLLLLMTFHGAGQARGRQIFRATRYLCSWPILMNF